MRVVSLLDCPPRRIRLLTWRCNHDADAAKTEQQKREEEEAKILAAQEATRKTLAGAEEIAKGIVYTERMKTS